MTAEDEGVKAWFGDDNYFLLTARGVNFAYTLFIIPKPLNCHSTVTMIKHIANIFCDPPGVVICPDLPKNHHDQARIRSRSGMGGEGLCRG